MKEKSFISCFFERINREIRMFNLKRMLVFGGIFLLVGIIFQILGGRTENIVHFYIFPRCALSVPIMFIFWEISFFYSGMLFSAIIFGCEKYRRNASYKCALMFVVSVIFTFGVYPLFFGSASLFFTFIVLLISQTFCFLALMFCIKIYSLWSICLAIHFLWLIYNGYVTLAFAIIN